MKLKVFSFKDKHISITLGKRSLSIDIRAAACLVVAALVFVLAYIGANRPVALYNADAQDAEALYFAHVNIATSFSKNLLLGELIAQDYPDDGTAVSTLEYETGVVTEVINEDWVLDPYTENVHVGMQELRVKLLSGRFKGTEHTVINQMSKSFDKFSRAGTRLLLYVKTDRAPDSTLSEPSLSIINYDRSLYLYLLAGLFLIVTIIVGGRVGARSIIALAFTLSCVIALLIPLILRGYHPIWLTLALCIYVTIVSFVLLDGIGKKTAAAIMGTVIGFMIAALFAQLAGSLARIDGLEYNVEQTDTLIQAKYQGTPIYIRGLFVSGIIIASLGAVMDVAMSISSAITELKVVNGALGRKQLFKSGMNIGRDAVGTMTNTLILAFTGGALVELVLINLYDWDFRAIINSDYLTNEIITGLAGSIGLILAVPATALVASLLIGGSGTQPLQRRK